MVQEFVVVGAGFSGAVVSERIAEVLKKKVYLIEKRDHLGGNSYDYKGKEGIRIHKYGPHIFHTNSLKVFKYLSQFTSWKEYKHQVLVKLDDKLIHLPFNFLSIDEFFEKSKGNKYKEELLNEYGKNKKIPIYRLISSKNSTVKEIGEFIFEYIFKNYSQKQWGRDILKLDREVLKRVPVYTGYTKYYFDDKFQFMPSDGFENLFKNLLSNSRIELILNTNANSMLKLKDGDIYFDGKKFKGLVIYTAPPDELFEYKFGKLEYRSLYFEFETVKKKYFQPVSVINYPSLEFKFTRITEYKHFLNEESEKSVISKEYPGEYEPSDPKFSEPYYPILNKENRRRLALYLKLQKNYENLYFLGRLGEYKYINMNQAVEGALELFEEIKRSYFE